jgi:hypothetical protein
MTRSRTIDRTVERLSPATSTSGLARGSLDQRLPHRAIPGVPSPRSSKTSKPGAASQARVTDSLNAKGDRFTGHRQGKTSNRLWSDHESGHCGLGCRGLGVSGRDRQGGRRARSPTLELRRGGRTRRPARASSPVPPPRLGQRPPHCTGSGRPPSPARVQDAVPMV